MAEQLPTGIMVGKMCTYYRDEIPRSIWRPGHNGLRPEVPTAEEMGSQVV